MNIDRRSFIFGALGTAGCGLMRSDTHYIPTGYIGPVVILFDEPTGVAQVRGRWGAYRYTIPQGGVLWIKDPAPPDGWTRDRYFYGAPDGRVEPIPTEAGHDAVQVFHLQFGSRGTPGVAGGRAFWTYIVGMPVARGDWVELQERTIDALFPNG